MEVSGGKAATTTTSSSREFFKVKQVENSNSALLSLAFYSFLMFTVPIGVFFFGKFYTVVNIFFKSSVICILVLIH
jgi:hypothetical protein